MRTSAAFVFVFLCACAAPTGEEAPVGQAEQALSIPIEFVDIGYDDIAAGIAPCGVIPAGVHTAATTGFAEFLFFFEASYTSAGEPVYVSDTFLLSSLAAEAYEPGFVTVELFVAGPSVDDIDNGVIPCGSLTPLALAMPGGSYDDPGYTDSAP